jgi:tripartite-type tricarboxylate transporter receptor subunit TctC
MPELPTIAESGLPGFAIDTWFGLFAPGGTPAEVVQRLNDVFVKALQEPDVKARFAQLMAEPSPTTPAQFGDFVKSELAKYEKVVKASGASLN